GAAALSSLQLKLSWTRFCRGPLTIPNNYRCRDIGDGSDTRHAKNSFHLFAENRKDALDTGRSEGAHAPCNRTACENGFSAERQRLYNIAATSDAAVQDNRHFAADRFNDLGQSFKRRTIEVKNPPTVIRND